MGPHSVSIVVPAYNCETTIRETIKGCLDQTYQDCEVIIVDDGSTDGTAEAVKSFSGVRYFFQSNSGPASARNRGAREASGKYVLFTDSDCVPQKDWVEKTLAGFISPEVAVVSGSYGIANPERFLARCIHGEIIYRHNFRMPEYPNVFGSFNFAAKKDVLLGLKGFNESYRHASGEDNDLSYRILKAGHLIRFEPKSIVRHYHQTSVMKYFREQFRHGFWRAMMYRDHPEMMTGDGYTFWKDSVEVGLVFLFIGALICSLWQIFFLKFSFFILGILVVLQIRFACLHTRSAIDAFFWSFIMSGRSFARAIGFSTGVLCFSAKENEKNRK